jgi:hypothetical protein
MFLCLVSAPKLGADTKTFDANSTEAQENLAMIAEYHLAKQPVPLAYEAVAVQMMLREANHVAERLKLPTSHPIQLTGIRYPYISPPWYSMLKETSPPFWPITVFSNHIFDTNIPREQRARAFKICLRGTIETTNLLFAFDRGRLSDVERISENRFQYCSTDLDKLVGKTSLINDIEAHEMATQWLAAVDINVAALEKKYPPEVHHLKFTPENSTNAVELPIYFVTWGWIGAPISSEPLAEVKILGTTKELVELSFPGLFRFSDASFSERPPLLITNAIDLIQMGTPPLKHLERSEPQSGQNSNALQSPMKISRP